VEGKAAVRALLAGFLVPLHVFAEIGGVSVSIQWSPLTGDRPDETHSAWTLELRALRAQVAGNVALSAKVAGGARFLGTLL